MLLKTKPTDIGKKLGPEAHWMLIKWSHLKSTCGLLTSIEVLILGHRTGHPGGTELGKRSKALITFRTSSWPRLRLLTWKENPPRWLEIGKSFDCLPHMCRSRSGCIELIKNRLRFMPNLLFLAAIWTVEGSFHKNLNSGVPFFLRCQRRPCHVATKLAVERKICVNDRSQAYGAPVIQLISMPLCSIWNTCVLETRANRKETGANLIKKTCQGASRSF